MKVEIDGAKQRSRCGVSLVALALLASSCGSERSVEAFCSTYEEETERLVDKYGERAAQVEGESGLIVLGTAFGSLIEAQGDVVVFFERLERNAPEEIAPDVAAVHEALEKQADATASGDFTKMLFGGAVTALQAAGPATRVDAYLQQNCGETR